MKAEIILKRVADNVGLLLYVLFW